MQSTCIVCEAQIVIPTDAEVSEVITCPDCKSRLVVEKLEGTQVTLAKAPAVEEDWGE